MSGLAYKPTPTTWSATSSRRRGSPTPGTARAWGTAATVGGGRGTVWACGNNSSGQLGAGSSAQGYTPIQVSGLTNVTGVAAGDAHSLAVESDGTVWGWGSNNSGQIGAGLAVTRYTPVQMPGITTATAVVAGSAHSLARLADGTVRAWGDNTKGQLGDGTTNGSTTPVTVLGLQGVDRIAARANGSLARPTQANEQYAYDADGQRVTRSIGGVTWLSLGGGMWEERLGASAAGPGGWVVRQIYMLQGRAVAQQEDTPNSINYPSGRVFLHGDHLGSVSVVTDNDRRVLSRQDYTPWGEVRAGGVAQTTLDFTGQRRDGTGLLYYGARYYDPQLGRFLSADSIVPGMASGQGGMAATLGQDGGAALRPLAVDFHESGFAATLAREDAFTQAKGFRFQLSDQDRQQAKVDTGPGNPQALNRYSYVLDNPLRYTDPTGHWVITIQRDSVLQFRDQFVAIEAEAVQELINLAYSTGGSYLSSPVFDRETAGILAVATTGFILATAYSISLAYGGIGDILTAAYNATPEGGHVEVEFGADSVITVRSFDAGGNRLYGTSYTLNVWIASPLVQAQAVIWNGLWEAMARTPGTTSGSRDK